MYEPAGVQTSPGFPIPSHMKAWVLGGPDELLLREKPTPTPGRAEVLVRIDAVAICATDLEIIHGGSPASIQGGLPFNKNFTPGHEYMGTVAALGPGRRRIRDRRTRQRGNPRRLRPVQAMPPGHVHVLPQLRPGPTKGHRANEFTTDGGFAEYAINHINTLARVPDTMTDAEATLVVTAGTSMYGLTELGGLVAGESVVVIGPGPDRAARGSCRQSLGRKPGDPGGGRDGDWRSARN